LLLALTAAVYGRVLDYPVLNWDDGVYVAERPILAQVARGEPAAWLELLSPQEALSGYFWEYLPLRDLSYAVDARLGGILPRQFHLTNLLLHLVNVLLLGLLGRELLNGSSGWALLAGLAFFALHPLAVEPVAWVSGRKELLYVTFVLVALNAVLALRRGRTLGLSLLMLTSVVCAFLSKASAVVVVPLMLALIWGHGLPAARRERQILAVTLALAALLGAAWILIATQLGAQNQVLQFAHGGALGVVQRMLHAPGAFLYSVLLPVRLSPHYGQTTSSLLLDPFSWITVSGVAGLVLIWLWRPAWRRSTTLVLGLAVVIALFPAMGPVSPTQGRADRFFYLALGLLGLLLAQALGAGTRRWGWRAMALGALVPLVYGLSTHAYLEVWRSDRSLWRHVVELDPESALGHGSLGAIALEEGRFVEAKTHLERSVARAPHMPRTWVNLGLYHWYRAEG
jgi:hypothetical protein